MGLVSDKNTSQIQGLSNLYDTNELTTYDNNTLIIPPHPLGIKPAGNAFTAHENLKSAAGYFFALPDELIVQILELLEKGSLLQLGATCKALYAFSAHDDLWKNFLIRYVPFYRDYCRRKIWLVWKKMHFVMKDFLVVCIGIEGVDLIDIIAINSNEH